MTATATLYPTTVAGTTGSTWTNTANATGSTTGTVATFTNAASGGVGTIQLSGYAAQTVVGTQPQSVDSVAVTVRSYVAATNRWSSATAQLYAGTTAIGSAQALTLATATTNSQTLTFTGVSWANLADLRVQVTATHTTTTSSTFNLDVAGVVVNYTPPAPADTYGALVYGDSPSAFYRFDGSTADAMGGASGTISGGVTYGTALITAGQGAVLDGSTGRITYANSTALNPTGPLTLECWVKPTAAGSNVDGFNVICGKTSWCLQFQLSTMVPSFFMTGGSLVGASSGYTLTYGQAYHLVGTWDGTIGSLYVNGSLVATGAGRSQNDTGTLVVGCFTDGSDHTTGTVDEVAVYGFALSATQVANHYAAGAPASGEVHTTSGTATAKAAASAVTTHVTPDWFGSDAWVGSQAWGAHTSDPRTTTGTATAKAVASATTATVRSKIGTATAVATATRSTTSTRTLTGTAAAKAVASASDSTTRTTTGIGTAKATATATTAATHPSTGTAAARGAATAATSSTRTLTGSAAAKAAASAATSHVEGDHVTTGTAVAKAAATFSLGTVRTTTGTAAGKATATAITAGRRTTAATASAMLAAAATTATVRSGSGVAAARSVASAIIRTDRGGQAYATARASASAVTGIGSPFRDISVTWGRVGVSRTLTAAGGKSRTMAAVGASRTLTAVPEE